MKCLNIEVILISELMNSEIRIDSNRFCRIDSYFWNHKFTSTFRPFARLASWQAARISFRKTSFVNVPEKLRQTVCLKCNQIKGLVLNACLYSHHFMLGLTTSKSLLSLPISCQNLKLSLCLHWKFYLAFLNEPLRSTYVHHLTVIHILFLFPVFTPPLTMCLSSPTVLTSPTGNIGSITTAESGYGSDSCPWVIQADPGQRVSLTLLDFSSLEVVSWNVKSYSWMSD